jgi:hypothetical protein
MSGTTTLAHSPSPSFGPNGAHSSLTNSTQPKSKAPRRKRGATRSVPGTTPLTDGSSVGQSQELDADSVGEYDSTDYENSILQDFERHRVFVDIEVFMKHVLHVPDDWETRWGSTIERIKVTGSFSALYMKYCAECNIRGVQEKKPYGLLMGMGNAILDVASESPLEESTRPKPRQRHLVSDPNKVPCGITNEAHLTSDLVAVHGDPLLHFLPEGRRTRFLKESYFTRAQLLQPLEVKPLDTALVDGLFMPRLKVDGKFNAPHGVGS